MAKHESQACLRGDPTRKSRRFGPYLENIAFFGGGFDDLVSNDERLGTNAIFGASVMVDRNSAQQFCIADLYT